MNVAVKELPRYRVAYMRYVGPYGAHGIPELWERFRAWGDRRELGVTEFVGSPHTIRDAWEALYRSWLPGSGYQPDDRPCIEIYRGNPEVAGRPDTFRCELAMPVRPL